MPLAKFIAIVLTIAAVLVVSGFGLIASLRPAEIVHGYGVVSPCGLYGVIVVWDDGTHELFKYDKPAPREVIDVLNANDKIRTAIPVPCPNPSFRKAAALK